MDPSALEALVESEHDQVVRWREHELERVGFDIALARTLARRLDVDLHQAVDLVNNGCSPDLVARILL